MGAQSEKENRNISLEVLAKDRKGLVNEITMIISSMNISILRHNARVYNHMNKGKVSQFKADVEIVNEQQIEMLISRLRKIKGNISVDVVC